MYRPDDDWIPMSIQDWLASASELYFGDNYLKSAINVALLLAKQISQMIASGDLSLSDISVDNVIIFVQGANILSIKAVRFELDAPGILPQRKGAAFSTPQSECAALGEILLELFSRGRSKSLNASFEGTDRLRGIKSKTYQSDGTSLDQEDGNDSYCGKIISQWTISDREDVHMQPSEEMMAADVSNVSGAAKTLLLNSGMPLSICRLVCDLLRSSAYAHETFSNSSEAGRCTSLQEVICDLSNMKTHPQGFLYEHSCPQRALDDTSFFRDTEDIIYHLYGSEISDSLVRAKKNIFSHVSTMDSVSSQDNSFLCETVFVSGSTPDDKTSLIDSLINTCNAEEWFVINCKLDPHTAPQVSLAKALDDFFRKYGSANDAAPDSMMSSFCQVCSVIFTTVNNEMFLQICESITPSLSKVFPAIATKSGSQETESIAPAQYMRLFHVLFKSLCSSGRPVLITLDGLSESSLFVLDVLSEFVNQDNNSSSRISHGSRSRKQGMLVAGTFDPQERKCIRKKINYIKHSKKTTVTELSIHSRDKDDLAKLLSRSLYLPTRNANDLAKIIYRKTRGRPSFILSFVRSIIQANLLSFSVESRRWVWPASISNEHISDKVVQVMIKELAQLPRPLLKTLQILSCLGCQEFDTAVINALNSGQKILPFDMKHEIDRAEEEGLVDKVGTRYLFSHVLIKQAIYGSIQAKNRKLLHKIIGEALLKNAADDPTLCLLGTDQINIYCSDQTLGEEEYSKYVSMNISAANYAIRASEFDRAQTYIDIGMKLVKKTPSSKNKSESESHLSATNHGSQLYPVPSEGSQMPVSVGGRPSINSPSDSLPSNARASHLTQQCPLDLGSFEASKPRCDSLSSEKKPETLPLSKVVSSDDLVFIQVLFQYLERNDKAVLDLAKMVIKDCKRKHSTNDSRFTRLDQAIKERLRNTVGETHWAKALAFREQLLRNQHKKKSTKAATAPTTQEKAQKDRMVESTPQKWQSRVNKRKKRRSTGYGSSSGNSSDSSLDSLTSSKKSSRIKRGSASMILDNASSTSRAMHSINKSGDENMPRNDSGSSAAFDAFLRCSDKGDEARGTLYD